MDHKLNNFEGIDRDWQKFKHLLIEEMIKEPKKHREPYRRGRK